MDCEYGCGHKFKYILKNNKKCCSESFYLCDGYKRKLSKSRKKTKKCPKCNNNIDISHYKRHTERCGKTVICKNCNKEIPYNKKFCNSSCAALFNNRLRKKVNDISYCKNCNTFLNGKDRKFCNPQCQSEYNKKENIKKWMDGIISGTTNSGYLANFVRSYIFEKYEYKCGKCGWDKIDEITGKTPLHINHKDGIGENNKEDNLILLCPNCHWLTDTFGGRNQKKGKNG